MTGCGEEATDRPVRSWIYNSRALRIGTCPEASRRAHKQVGAQRDDVRGLGSGVYLSDPVKHEKCRSKSLAILAIGEQRVAIPVMEVAEIGSALRQSRHPFTSCDNSRGVRERFAPHRESRPRLRIWTAGPAGW